MDKIGLRARETSTALPAEPRSSNLAMAIPCGAERSAIITRSTHSGGPRMSDKLAQAATELGPVAQLLTHYAEGSDAAIAEATKLTLGMITETATWFDGKGDPRAA